MVPLYCLMGVPQTVGMSHNTSSRAELFCPAISSSEAYPDAAAENYPQESCGLVMVIDPEMFSQRYG